MSTVPAQTGDWNIISGAIIVTCYEIISRILYKSSIKKTSFTISLINNFKVGIVYGLFVDAFKLGS
uniref:Ycf20 n=1 Tax=Laurencia obtusa TaxID=137763 RepID=UPI0028D03B5F|nr:Ycf20 [Laurencia obtusa]WMP12868.1 Ycf20 [Laurencia obtusa]